MAAAGVKLSQGDIRCLASGHIARVAINRLRDTWDTEASLSERMKRAEERLVELADNLELALMQNPLLDAEVPILMQKGQPQREGGGR